MFLVGAAEIDSAGDGGENLEERAAREAKEFTEKYCPTPVQENERTDSLVYQPATKTYIYYRTLCGIADNQEVINEHKAQLIKALKDATVNNTAQKPYKEANFRFRYVYHSESEPNKVLLECLVTPKDYQ